MIVYWTVEDGYVGSGEQVTEIPDDEFEGMDEEEKSDTINEWVQEDFLANIGWSIERIEE